jgi:hypothetical protein
VVFVVPFLIAFRKQIISMGISDGSNRKNTTARKVGTAATTQPQQQH